MPPVVSVAEQIVDDMEQTLLALQADGSGDYFYRPELVEVGVPKLDEVSEYPSYFVVYRRWITRRRLPNNILEGDYTGELHCIGKGETSRERDRMVARMSRDIAKALEVDVHRGLASGDCFDTIVLAAENAPSFLDGTKAYGVMRWRCPSQVCDGEL